MKIYDNWQEAEETILRRRGLTTLDDAPGAAPEAVTIGIRRVFGEPLTPEEAVARILADVRQRGDAALRDWTARIDGVTLDGLEVPGEAWAAAYDALPADLAEALALAAERIRAFHARQPISSWTVEDQGGMLGLQPGEYAGRQRV